MTLFSKISVLYHVLKWRLTWNRRDTHYRFTIPDNPKFMGPRDAVKLIPDGAVVAASGLGANQWASILYWSIRELFQETGHPRDLTVMAIGGMGARGRAPGSLEELGLPGLCTRFFSGHLETFKAMLRLADQGKLELQCIPQGVMAFLIEGQGHGETSLLTSTGIGTFMDPRVGRGSPVTPPAGEQWVAVENGKLRYRLPPITVAMFNAPSADREGNIYMRHTAMLAESREIAKAARANGGLVIVNVGYVVEKNSDDIFLPASDVDAVVVYPRTEQTGSVKHRKHWPMFTTESDMPIAESVAKLKYANETLRITPRRTAVDDSLARLAATAFAENVRRGSLVNIGVGLPEEVCRLLYEAGLYEDITLFTESGVIGGLPAPGVFFGAAICPKKMITSAEIFHRCYESLDVSILGMLQCDSDGNVNVSKRGEGAINYVGPGGFIDFTTAARTIIFVSSWMLGGKIRLEGNALRIVEYGKPKFIANVDEITFSGRQALATGKKVLYVSNVGIFQLTPRGMELVRIVPGIDIRKDILDFSPMRILLPESGDVPTVDPIVVSGKGFRLSFK
ncbi:MAG TPA: CoA-transferase [Candidatus Hydrogenedentes bacterium]|nr:CoA-transferase [Candidatus Hydrogenedentota bacterium]